MTERRKAGNPEGQPARIVAIAAVTVVIGCSAPFTEPADGGVESVDSSADASDAGADVSIVAPPT